MQPAGLVAGGVQPACLPCWWQHACLPGCLTTRSVPRQHWHLSPNPSHLPPTSPPLAPPHRLLEWQQQRVWRNSRPQEAAFPVQLQYSHGSSGGGRLKALPGPAALLAARAAQPLAGHTLLWLPPARDASLAEAAENLGASNHDVAASGRAPAAAKAAGAVLVRGSATDTVPAAYRRLPWTTPELLIVSGDCCCCLTGVVFLGWAAVALLPCFAGMLRAGVPLSCGGRLRWQVWSGSLCPQRRLPCACLSLPPTSLYLVPFLSPTNYPSNPPTNPIAGRHA